MARADLKQLMGHILDLTPRYHDLMVDGIPGMGAQNTDVEPVDRLRKTATRFAQAYADPKADEAEVRQLAGETEGAIMAVATIGVTDAANADTVIDELHDLVEEKYS